MRPFLVVVGAIALLFAGAIAVVWVVTDGSPSPEEPTRAQPPEVPAPAPDPGVAAAPVAAGAQEPLRPIPLPPAPAAPAGSAAAREVRTLPRPLPAVAQALSRLAAPCFDEDTQARFGPRSHTSIGPASEARAAGLAALLVELEAVDGGLRVIDAPVATRGNASDGLLACAQEALRGRVVAVPSGVPFEPRQRVRMRFPLR